MIAIRSKRPVELLLHVTSRCTATGPLRSSWMITDYRLSQNEAFPLMKCIWR